MNVTSKVRITMLYNLVKLVEDVIDGRICQEEARILIFCMLFCRVDLSDIPEIESRPSTFLLGVNLVL